MKWRNSAGQYGWLAMGLHWLMLALLVAVFASMELRGIYPKGSAMREAMKSWHYVLGMAVLGLAVIRLVVSWIGPVPAITPLPARWQLAAAAWMKFALFLFMFAMPLLGWALLSAEGTPVAFFGCELPALVGRDTGLAQAIEEVHETGASIGYVLIGLHACAALYHHYFFADDTLRRMLPARSRR